jgi:hypothetical protein
MRTLEQASHRLFAARYDVQTEDYVESAGLTTVDRRLVFSDMVRLLELRPSEPGDAPPRRRTTAAEPQSATRPEPDGYPAPAR